LRPSAANSTAEDDRRRAVLDWLRLHPGWFLVINSRD
jgi:hypothetical protein